MRLVTPDKIRTLQRKLYLKAKREPAYRFYSIYDKIYRRDILLFAYKLVRANGGTPGIDGINFDEIERDKGISGFLAKLGQELQEKSYKADPVRRVMIPKANGKQRPLGIPTIRDRVVQMATKLVIEPIFEADFIDHSFGFRPKRGQHDALNSIRQAMATGHTNVVDADLSKYFDTIPHAKLLKIVAERICDQSILHLLKMWLKAPVIEEKNGKKKYIGGGKQNRLGTPQGGVISPLLANLYLHILDRIWERHRLAESMKSKIVRYADDFVVLCKGNVAPAMQIVKRVLERLDLQLNEDKTKTVDAYAESFSFLGFEIQMRKSIKSGKYYPHAQPSKKSLVNIKSEVRNLTKRENTMLPMEDIMANLNRKLRGWVGYFHYGNSSKCFSRLRGFVENRVRLHSGGRHKIRSNRQSLYKIPRETVYTQHKLYKIPTTAGWKKVHAFK